MPTEFDNLDGSGKPLLYLRYPLNSKSHESKYVMNINIFKQSVSGDRVRPLASTSNLDAERYKNRAGRGNETIDLDKATAVLGVVQVTDTLLGGIANPLTSAVTGAFKRGTVALVNTIVNSKINLDRKTEIRPLSYISLYMPESLTFTDQHNFNPLSLTDAMGTAGLLTQAGSSLKNIFGEGPGRSEILSKLGESFGLFNSGYTDASIYQQGFAINPQLLLLYKGSGNRQFIFQFRLVPRNQDEAQEIIDIVRTLRYHAAPDFQPGVSSRYFVPPSEFEIEFLIRDTNGNLVYNEALPRIGQSVLTGVDVNYAPNGFYAAYKDGMPTEIQLQLTFVETVILTKSDIGDLGY